MGLEDVGLALGLALKVIPSCLIAGLESFGREESSKRVGSERLLCPSPERREGIGYEAYAGKCGRCL